MEPFCVCPRRQKHNHGAAAFSGLLYPLSDLSAIRGIAPAHTLPFLRKAVLLPRVILRTLRVFSRCADVQLKPEFRIQRLKKRVRRAPLVRRGRKQCLMHALTPPVQT